MSTADEICGKDSMKETVSLILNSCHFIEKVNLDVAKITTSIDIDLSKSVTINSEQAWGEFFAMQNNPSTNTTNPRKPKIDIHKDSDGIIKYTARDENKYWGKFLVGKIPDQIKEEITKHSNVKFIRIKERKMASVNEDAVTPSVRIVLHDNMKGINLNDLLSGDVCKKYGINTVTLCYDEGKIRGIRLCVDENGTRTYEVANGSYEMILAWQHGKKECTIKISIHDDGSVKYIESNGVTWEQLATNKTRVGKQFDVKRLIEALSYSKQEGDELVKAPVE